MLKKIYLFAALFVFTNCDNTPYSSDTIIDKGVLLNKTEYFGRFGVEIYTFSILYKSHIYHKDVDKNMYEEYNVKDSVEFTITNFSNNTSTIDITLPKN